MIQRLPIVTALGLIAASAGAAQEEPRSAGTATAPAAGANVYIFRDYAEPKAWAPTVKIDGRKIASIGMDRYTALRLEPGEHHIKMSWPLLSAQRSAEGRFTVRRGQTYYFEITGTARLAGAGSTPGYMTFLVGSGLVPRGAEARAMIAECCTFKPPR